MEEVTPFGNQLYSVFKSLLKTWFINIYNVFVTVVRKKMSNYAKKMNSNAKNEPYSIIILSNLKL